ncbi:MAG TPA: hypothetical protein VMV74_05110 [Bacteroidales bacterium]|nr:hypothetical protein [Bacteroidales bacterium]
MKAKALILFIALLGFMATSCQKNATIEVSSVEAADDAAFAETIFNDVFSTLEIATTTAESMLKSASVVDSCPIVTVTFPGQGLWPRNVVVDYGEGCTGLNDVVRSGKIYLTVTGPRREAGSTRTVTFDNYYCNDVKIEGTKVVENMGPNDAGNVVFSVQLTGGKITLPDERVILSEFNKGREYIGGYLTRNMWDDECMITGVSSGVNLKGLSYTHTITNALHWTAACRFIVSGTVFCEAEGIESFELDYGEGECDAFATVKRGDETREITLRYRHPKITPGR